MAKKPPTPEKPRQRLPADDAVLWEQVARSATPLRRGKNRLSQQAVPATANEKTPPPEPPKPVRSQMPNPAPKRAEAPKPPPALYDRREARKLAAGRVDIDARIDLHGMRQREAHGALNAFLAHAQARGYRHVLVITGKGTRRSDPEADDFPATAAEPGVLRRALPQWLDGAALRTVVVSYTQAAARHGGEGAFYVRLRKAGK